VPIPTVKNPPGTDLSANHWFSLRNCLKVYERILKDDGIGDLSIGTPCSGYQTALGTIKQIQEIKEVLRLFDLFTYWTTSDYLYTI
jgi:hypothetical protein